MIKLFLISIALNGNVMAVQLDSFATGIQCENVKHKLVIPVSKNHLFLQCAIIRKM